MSTDQITKLVTRLLFLAAFSTGLAGCGKSDSSSIVGTWQTSLTQDGAGYAGTETITFAADGSATYVFAPTELAGFKCTGSDDLAGTTWTASDGTLTFAGDTVCKTSNGIACEVAGSPMEPICPGGTLASGESPAGTLTYAFSNDDDTLTLTSSDGAYHTYTRQ